MCKRRTNTKGIFSIETSIDLEPIDPWIFDDLSRTRPVKIMHLALIRTGTNDKHVGRNPGVDMRPDEHDAQIIVHYPGSNRNPNHKRRIDPKLPIKK